MKKSNKLPNFSKMTYAEETKFWDTHNVTDFENETEDVKIIFELDKPREKTVVVRLQEEFKDRLEKTARSRGLNVSTLVRMWLTEKMNQTAKSS